MHSLIREVLFPSTAAIGLLAAAFVDPAVADESTFPLPAAVAAVAGPVTTQSTVAALAGSPTPVARPLASVETPAESNESNGIERRCERTGRIGKFRITRCD